jgi:N-acyl homoserine lactone hydrolase
MATAPTHASTRTPNASAHATYTTAARSLKVHVISTGAVRIKERQHRAPLASRPVRLASVFADQHWSDWLPIYVWVIEHPEGLMLVDSGESSQPTPGLRHPYAVMNTRFRVAPTDEIGPQLARLGFASKDVRWVVLTHLHPDHDGGLHHFPQAEFIVAGGEYAAARGLAGRLSGHLPQRWPAGWAPTTPELRPEPYGPFQQSLRLTQAGDVLLLPTPGHTNHHRSVVVRDGDTHLFLAGDASYSQTAMLEGWVDGVGPDALAQRQTLATIREFARTYPTIYLPSHDPEAAERLAQRQLVY